MGFDDDSTQVRHIRDPGDSQTAKETPRAHAHTSTLQNHGANSVWWGAV